MNRAKYNLVKQALLLGLSLGFPAGAFQYANFGITKAELDQLLDDLLAEGLVEPTVKN